MSTHIDSKFIDLSRIDGRPIFEFTRDSWGYPIVGYMIFGIKISSIEIVDANTLGDHVPRYRIFNENKENLCKYFFDLYGVTDDILFNKELYESKMVSFKRDIKIGLIIG